MANNRNRVIYVCRWEPIANSNEGRGDLEEGKGVSMKFFAALLLLASIVACGPAPASSSAMPVQSHWNEYVFNANGREIVIHQSKESGKCLYTRQGYHDFAVGEFTPAFCLELIQLSKPK